jgi:hypothetical protein
VSCLEERWGPAPPDSVYQTGFKVVCPRIRIPCSFVAWWSAGNWTHAKPRREPQGAFESLRCGLDQPVVFEPLMGVDGRTQVRATDASLRATFL